MTQDKQLIYLNAFNLLPNIGSATVFKIAEKFSGDFESAWKAPDGKFKNLGLDAEQITSLGSRNKIDPEKEFQKLEKENIKFITCSDENYPEPLKHIGTPPYALYVRGELPTNWQTTIAIVGTRMLTEYGKQVAPKLAYEIAVSGFTIISGLATGIDTLAHKAALDAGQKTIAVLGTGLDRKSFFPQQNWDLSLKIAQKGAVISEYPLGMKGSKEKFPLRNRIISGLSRGVIVIEADARSGALITARYALEQNRDVFAVPGGIFWPKSKGTNDLIKQGARPLLSVKDVLEEYNMETQELKPQIVPETEDEKAIFASLTSQPTHIEDIAWQSKLDMGRTIATLTMMEMKGMIKNVGGDRYTKD